jgi:hypothetical protein
MVNLKQDFDPSIVLPVDCFCSLTDLICVNQRPNTTPEATMQKINTSARIIAEYGSSLFPTLSILFQNQSMINKEQNFQYNILPKQKFSFFAYKHLVPYLFDNVKFINDQILLDNQSVDFNQQSIILNFIESIHFPTNTFASFGNLQLLPLNRWPKVFLNIFIEHKLELEPDSISGLKIEKLLIQDTNPAKNQSMNKSEFSISPEALTSSQVNLFEIKNAVGFTGFEIVEKDNNVIVSQLVINKCRNFSLKENFSLPLFYNLSSLSIVNCDLAQIPPNLWIKKSSNKNKDAFKPKYDNLKVLDLSGNKIESIDRDTFLGASESLEYLDLSNNTLTRIDWSIFNSKSFPNLKHLNLSFNPELENWFDFVTHLKNANLEILSLRGYKYNFTEQINHLSCANRPINFINFNSTVFIELDRDFECDCFLYSLYKIRRVLNPNFFYNLNSSSYFNFPKCYLDLYISNLTQIKLAEEKCDLIFYQILNETKCGAKLGILGVVNASSNEKFAKTKSGSSGVVVSGSDCAKLKSLAVPGQTIIKIGNQTIVSNPKNSHIAVKNTLSLDILPQEPQIILAPTTKSTTWTTKITTTTLHTTTTTTTTTTTSKTKSTRIPTSTTTFYWVPVVTTASTPSLFDAISLSLDEFIKDDLIEVHTQTQLSTTTSKSASTLTTTSKKNFEIHHKPPTITTTHDFIKDLEELILNEEFFKKMSNKKTKNCKNQADCDLNKEIDQIELSKSLTNLGFETLKDFFMTKYTSRKTSPSTKITSTTTTSTTPRSTKITTKSVTPVRLVTDNPISFFTIVRNSQPLEQKKVEFQSVSQFFTITTTTTTPKHSTYTTITTISTRETKSPEYFEHYHHQINNDKMRPSLSIEDEKQQYKQKQNAQQTATEKRTIIVCIVLSSCAFALLALIIGLIVYFKNKRYRTAKLRFDHAALASSIHNSNQTINNQNKNGTLTSTSISTQSIYGHHITRSNGVNDLSLINGKQTGQSSNGNGGGSGGAAVTSAAYLVKAKI